MSCNETAKAGTEEPKTITVPDPGCDTITITIKCEEKETACPKAVDCPKTEPEPLACEQPKTPCPPLKKKIECPPPKVEECPPVKADACDSPCAQVEPCPPPMANDCPPCPPKADDCCAPPPKDDACGCGSKPTCG